MTKSKDGPRLTGDNAKPIVRINPLVAALISHGLTETRQRAVVRAAVLWPYHEQLARIAVIASHYEIEQADINYWQKLAIKLCESQFKEIRIFDDIPRGRGAPKKYGIELIRDVQLTSASTGKSIAETCKSLSKDGKWKGAKNLEQRYYDEVEVMEKMRSRAPDRALAYLTAVAKGEIEEVP